MKCFLPFSFSGDDEHPSDPTAKITEGWIDYFFIQIR